jgi:hypothetical protein
MFNALLDINRFWNTNETIEDDIELKTIIKIKSILKAGDIIITEPAHFSRRKVIDWVAKGSRVVQNTRWGHTALYDGKGNLFEARVDVLIGQCKQYDGIVSRDLGDIIIDQNFLIVRPIVEEQVKINAINRMNELLDKKHIRYDKFRFVQGGLDILGIRKLRVRNFEEGRRIICSEAVAKAYWDWLKFVDDRHYSQILPIHIINSSKVQHIAIVDRNTKGKVNVSMVYKGA